MWASRYLDPLYGVVRLDDFEAQLIAAPEVQRLRYIRMCNINSMLVTGASEISRYEHSLGTLRLAQEWARVKGATRPPGDIAALRAAALLHDMQSGPFGHSFQYVLEDNEGDEFDHHQVVHHDKPYYQDLTINASFHGRHFKSKQIVGVNWDKVAEMIKGEGALGPLISGTIDLDNIDNVIRLAYHVGIADRNHAQLALLLAGKLVPTTDGRMSIDPEGVPLAEEWLKVRKRLYECLLLDWAEFSAKAMLTFAVEEAVEQRIIGNDSWLYTDDELLDKLANLTGHAQQISDVAQRLKCGELWSPVVLKASPDIPLYSQLSSRNAKRAIEMKINEQVREQCGFQTRFLFHLILDKAKTQRALVFVRSDTRQEVVIGESSCQLLVGVFSSRQMYAPAQSKALERVVLSVLQEYGLADLAPLPDPLQLEVEPSGWSQLSLL